MRILLVDDVQMERMQLAIRLKQLGHTVEMASSGQQAMDIYGSFDPELVLLDVSMPGVDGFEVCRQIREQFADWIPIIFLSGHDQPEMIASAIESGGDDYLVKPVDKIVLNSKLVAMQRIALMRRELKAKTAELAKLNNILQQQATEDSLTNLKNRRYTDNKLQELIALHGRHQFWLSLILIDVDNFKLFNDTYGHIAGDKCLVALSALLLKLFVRSGEFVARYGGEEIVIVLPHSNLEQAQQQARRIQQAVAELDYSQDVNFTLPPVTLSQGVLSLVPSGSETVDQLYQDVDRAMYKAKKAGKNCFVVHSDEIRN